MEKHMVLLSLVAVLSFCRIAFAYEPAPLQDFCVADLNSPVTVNGFSCKNPMMVQANDFLFRGFNIPGNTSNPVRSKVSPVTAGQLPGLNTFGIAMARVDYLPGGVNPPHYHPRASEIFTLIEGSLLVGFVTTNPENRLISKVLQKGDVFVFPKGLIHFQLNLGNEKALAIAALSSQNPGIMTVANAVFGSNPQISSEVLTKAFQTDKSVIHQILSKF